MVFIVVMIRIVTQLCYGESGYSALFLHYASVNISHTHLLCQSLYYRFSPIWKIATTPGPV